MADYFQCADCGVHLQTTPRGDTQGAACPECGGKRMFRMQPNPVQSEGTLRNMVDMETGKDAGGNPDGTGILAPASGRAILTGFIGEELECPACHMHTSEVNCPYCGSFIDPSGIASEHSGVPAELRPQIPGAPLTEGVIMNSDDTLPFDTGNRGRDEYTHGHIKKADHDYRIPHTAPSPEDSSLIDLERNGAKDIYTHPHYYGTGEDQYDNESFAAARQARGNPDALVTIHRAAPVGQINTGDWVSLSHGYAKQEGMHPSDPKQDLPVWSAKVPASSLFWNGDSINEFGYHGPDVEAKRFHRTLSNPELRDMSLEQPGKDTFPTKSTSDVLAAVAEPMQSLRCPQCSGEIMTDAQQGDAFCTHCDKQWPIHNEMRPVDKHLEGDTLHDLYQAPDVPTGSWTQQIPQHWGKTAGEIEDILGFDPPQQKNNLNWTPGWKGRGLVIGGEPHTWNSQHPDDPFASKFISHPEYVESLGIDPKHVDYKTGIEIDPDGKIIATGGHDAGPFIAADPRLKQVEEKFFPFSSAMPTTSRTNNMEPYDSLWAHEADVQFDQGPLQNTPEQSPPYSVVVQPSDLGVHGAHVGAKGVLSFLDAHINGTPVRGHAGELMTKYGFRKSPDFGKPLVVAVHDPAHLPVAVEALQHPEGHIRPETVASLMPRIQQGEIAAPPGIDPRTLNPQPGVFDQSVTARTAGLWGDLGAAALTAGGLALAVPTGGADLPEVAAGDAALLGGGAAAEGAGAAGAADAAGASGTAGGLMSKAMGMGTKGLAAQEGMGIGEKALGLGGGASGGEAAGGGGAGYSGPLQQFTHVLAAFVESDYETPSSVPDVGVKHDNPEDVDQKEFNDQDKSPENPMNPNLQDSGASGEDEVRKDMGKPSQGQFSPDSPAIQRMEMLMPLIEKHYHEGGGANDPMLKGLHEMLEAENPGYLNNADVEAAERFMQNKKKPDHIHATVHEAIMPPMQQGNLNAQQQALDPTGLNPSLQPSSQTPPGGGIQQGHCPRCGGVTGPDGSCPQCGAAGAAPQAPLPGGPSQIPHPQTFAHTDLLATFVDSANHQGPVTPEQIAAVQQYLIQEGRVDEVPNVPLDPGNPEYAKILAEIQNNPTNPPTVTPEEQTQPPPPQPAAPGGMPVPGMAPGETGGQPMQPMSSFLPDFIAAEEEKKCPGCKKPLHSDDNGTVTCIYPKCPYYSPGVRKNAADTIAPRCPRCGSGTTGMVGDQEHNARCHACHNIWKVGDVVSDENYGQTSIAKTALRDEHQHGGQSEQANPVGVPAAEQEGQTNQGGDEDSSLTWKDSTGAPLQAGQQYQMINPSFSLPDLVRVERVKPDGIDVTLLGTYANDPSQHDPNMLTSSTPISKQDMELQQLSFEPVSQTADDRNNEPPPGSQAPGLAQVPPSGQTTDEHAAQEPEMMAHSSIDPDCPRCGHMEYTSSMITAEATEHSCFRCGHDWVTEEKDLSDLGIAQRESWTNPSADWLNEDDNAEDLSPRRADMAHAGMQSRSISDIAGKDERLQAVREHLTREGQERQQRLAGKSFTRKEQRELIDEDGVARNADMLDLTNTHYHTRYDESGKANAERVRDSDLFLGL